MIDSKLTERGSIKMKKMNLNETEASEAYGPSVHWFRRARWQGDGPAYIKLKGSVLYPVAELDRYFSERVVNKNNGLKHG